jgi:putative phosphoribosyl transferase
MTEPTGGGTVGYADRFDAGRRLAEHLSAYVGRRDVTVLGLPRGGVVVAAAVASHLGADLDVFCVRKLGVPWHRELAMGAVASGGVRVLNMDVVEQLGIDPEAVERATADEAAELARRERSYRGDRPALDLTGRVAILVDDGIATGATARAAVTAVRRLGPSRVVLAVPVAPPDTLQTFAGITDEVVCPLTPDTFEAVGRWYQNFAPTTDTEVRALLAGVAPDEPCN